MVFDEPQCPHCGHYLDYDEWHDAQVGFEPEGTIVELECPACGEQWEADSSEIEYSDIEVMEE